MENTLLRSSFCALAHEPNYCEWSPGNSFAGPLAHPVKFFANHTVDRLRLQANHLLTMPLTADEKSALETAIRDALRTQLPDSLPLRKLPAYICVKAPRRGSLYVELSGYPIWGPYTRASLPGAVVADVAQYHADRSKPVGHVASTELPKASSLVDLLTGLKPAEHDR
jgi:hypothetical protein